MSTSADVTYYRVYKDNKLVKEHSQHCLCKNTIKDHLLTYTPPEDYTLQLLFVDEYEADHYSKKVCLKDYLDGKYKHTLWREDDGDAVDDSKYCGIHEYKHLKGDCPECLKAENKLLRERIRALSKNLF